MSEIRRSFCIVVSADATHFAVSSHTQSRGAVYSTLNIIQSKAVVGLYSYDRGTMNSPLFL